MKSPEDVDFVYDPTYKVLLKENGAVYTVTAKNDYEAVRIIARITNLRVEQFKIIQWPNLYD